MRKFEQPDELGAYDRWELKLGKKTSSQISPLVKEWADMVLFANYKTYAVAVDKDGKKFKAHVPAGVKDGQKIKLAGKGKLGINGGKAGDLYLHVTVKPDATFSMRGHDIVMDLPVTVGQAVAGGKVEAKDIDGNPVTFKVPAGSSSGAEVKLTGLGVQIMVPAKPGLAVKHAAKEFDEKAGDYLSL